MAGGRRVCFCFFFVFSIHLAEKSVAFLRLLDKNGLLVDCDGSRRWIMRVMMCVWVAVIGVCFEEFRCVGVGWCLCVCIILYYMCILFDRLVVLCLSNVWKCYTSVSETESFCSVHGMVQNT